MEVFPILLIIAFYAAIAATLIYLIVKRIEAKGKEDFEKE